MRLFVGIALPAEVMAALEAVSRGLRTSGEGLRWSSPETWHITLQFLGETTPENCECVKGRLREIRSDCVPVWLHGTGVFERAGVFWAGVTVSPELQLLQKAVGAAMANCGLEAKQELGIGEQGLENHGPGARENRPYRPHVTLARAKGDSRAAVLRGLKRRAPQDAEFPPFIATEFLLYESHQGPGGAKHEVRERFPLGAV